MRRQFILLMTDTQRKDMVGAYGNPNIRTPHLDQLASEGVLMEQCFTTNPVCGPARGSIFTGLFPHSNGVTANGLSPFSTVLTMADRLQKEGIQTAYIGKWHLDGGDYFGNGISPTGWDESEWYDMRNYLDELSEDERVKTRKQQSVLQGMDATITFANRCTNRAINYIKKHKDEDFLLVVSYDEPHHPYICPKEFYDAFSTYKHPKSNNVYDTLETKPRHQQLWAKQVNINPDDDLIEPYWFGCNSYVDSEIGRVLDHVQTTLEEPMILYTADHGGAFHSHRLSDKGPAMYDEITNVPFILKHTPTIQAQTIHNNIVSHIDILPTVLDFFNVPSSKNLQGESLLPQVHNPSKHQEDPRYMEYTRYEIDHDGFGGYQPIRCIVTPSFKLVINFLSSDELYDRINDPDEMNNLISSEHHIVIRNHLHDQLLDWMYQTRDPNRGYYWLHRSWRTDATAETWNDRGYTRQSIEETGHPKQLDYATGLVISEYTRKK